MHSKIIQLESCPIEAEDRITPSDYCADHWFAYSVADYVDDDDNPQATLQTLTQIFQSVGDHMETFKDEDGEGIIFKENFIHAYMEQAYRDFEEALRNLTAKASIDAFCEDKLILEMYQLNEAYEDEYGFYIQNDDEGLVTLNRFVHTIRPSRKYYFGGTVDYHF